ncbi:MAG: hypothetical protein HRU38_24350 [Saccharospirillaceae bacterium]|nr:hypothetical protein [Pseudomonadales bacterium]NRB81753.1 hypothetical protein [Saccharospirillaceae bacterium]
MLNRNQFFPNIIILSFVLFLSSCPLENKKVPISEQEQEQEQDDSNIGNSNITNNTLEYLFTDDSPCRFIINLVEFEDGIKQVTLLENIDDCLETVDFSDETNWTQQRSTLLYKLTVGQGGTDVDIRFIAQDLATLFKARILDEDMNLRLGSYSTPSPRSVIQESLDEGEYYIAIDHHYSENQIGSVYFELSSFNAQMKYIEEIPEPTILSQAKMEDNLIFELIISEPGIYRFRQEYEEYNGAISFSDLQLYDLYGVPLIKFFLNENWVFSEHFLQAGKYYVTAKGGSRPFFFNLQHHTYNESQFTLSEKSEVGVSNETPYSILLEQSYTQQDYTLKLNQENYKQIVELVNIHKQQNYNLKYALTRILISTNQENNNGILSTISEYSCEISGTYFEIKSDDESAQYYTNNCVMHSGPVTFRRYIENGESGRESYSMSLENGYQIIVDQKYSNNPHLIYNEIFINSEEFGSFLARSNRFDGRQYIFAANDTYLIKGYDQSFYEEISPCLYHFGTRYELNGLNLDEFDYIKNDCVENFNFEETTIWQHPKSVLEYTLTIEKDNTDIESFFGLDQSRHTYLNVSIYDQNLNPIYDQPYYNRSVNINKTLSAGTYKVYLRNSYASLEYMRNILIQIKADNSNFEFNREWTEAQLLVDSLTDYWQGDSKTQEYQLEIFEESNIIIDVITNPEFEFILESEISTLISQQYGSQNNPVNLKIKLPKGVYKLSLTNTQPSNQDIKLVLKSSIENSLSIEALYSI